MFQQIRKGWGVEGVNKIEYRDLRVSEEAMSSCCQTDQN